MKPHYVEEVSMLTVEMYLLSTIQLPIIHQTLEVPFTSTAAMLIFRRIYLPTIQVATQSGVILKA